MCCVHHSTRKIHIRTVTNTDLPRRKLHRLQQYDYSQNGCYYITVCTMNRRNILATYVYGESNVFAPTAIGNIVISAWEKMSDIDANIKTDYFCLMPNHIHGIIVIENQQNIPKGAGYRVGADNGGRRSLNDVVRGFKSVTTREFNKSVSDEMKNTLWQPSFYDEIIKDEEMLYKIRKYIEENPQKWREDELFGM